MVKKHKQRFRVTGGGGEQRELVVPIESLYDSGTGAGLNGLYGVVHGCDEGERPTALQAALDAHDKAAWHFYGDFNHLSAGHGAAELAATAEAVGFQRGWLAGRRALAHQLEALNQQREEIEILKRRKAV